MKTFVVSVYSSNEEKAAYMPAKQLRSKNKKKVFNSYSEALEFAYTLQRKLYMASSNWNYTHLQLNIYTEVCKDATAVQTVLSMSWPKCFYTFQ